MEILKQAISIFLKDLRLEIRSKQIINTALAFSGSALLIAIFSLKAQQALPSVKSGLIWLIILFASLSSIGRLFIAEKEQHTFPLMKLHTEANAFFLGKLLFNIIFLFVLVGSTITLYLILMDIVPSTIVGLYFCALLSAIAIGSATTLLAAIVAEADKKGSIFAVISIPVLFPALLLSVRLTQLCLFSANFSTILFEIGPLVGYCGAITTAAFLLYESVWNS